MKSKTIFKEKDRVYVTSLGCGKVIDAGCSTPTGWVGIETDDGRIIYVDTYLVSFTEYTLEGFSQERKDEDPAYFGWNNPVLSRKEVFDIIEGEINSSRVKADLFLVSKIKEKLREVAFINAKKTLKEQKD